MQNVELPTWFIMESKGGKDWLRPRHPTAGERDLEEQEEVTYAVVARVPECALWNFLDCRDGDGVPLMTAVEWLRFIQSRSQIDQEWMQAVMTRALLRAHWMDKVCQGMFYGWKSAHDRQGRKILRGYLCSRGMSVFMALARR